MDAKVTEILTGKEVRSNADEHQSVVKGRRQKIMKYFLETHKQNI